MRYETDASLSELVRGALTDVRELFREEVALARAEIREELSKASGAAIGFGIAAVSLLFALGCVVVALSLGIAAMFDWPAWSGFGLMAVMLVIVGAVGYASGRRAATNVRPLSRTVHTLKENFR